MFDSGARMCIRAIPGTTGKIEVYGPALRRGGLGFLLEF